MLQHRRTFVTFVAAALLLFACGSSDEGGSSAADPSSTPSSSPTSTELNYVSLGGSIAAGAGALYGEAYPDYLADLLREDGSDVELIDLSIPEGGTTEATLDLLAQPEAVAGLKDADLVTMEIGGNDLFAGDDPYKAGTCEGLACYDGPQASFEANYQEIVEQIASLTGGDAELRALTYYNPAIGDESIGKEFGKEFYKITSKVTERQNAATCRIAESAGWVCVDLYEPFNGPDGTTPPYEKELVIEGNDYQHPTKKGHELIASLLYDSL